MDSNTIEMGSEKECPPDSKGLEGDISLCNEKPTLIDSGKPTNTTKSSSQDVFDGVGVQQPPQTATQPHPKKKGGFAITSVKDNVDGDESADDLDESHTSYSDMSYSRTTDVDHDQESSASEDTLNITLQDGMQQLTSGQAVPHPAGGTNGKTKVKSVLPQNSLDSEASDSKLSSHQIYSDSQKDNDQRYDTTSNGIQVSSDLKETPVASLPPTFNSSQPGVFASKPVTGTVLSSQNNDTNAAPKAPIASTSGPMPKGAVKRGFKVVKRDNLLPIRRERLRWICHDYTESQSPNLGFVAHSASDTKLNHPEMHQHSIYSTNTLPSSMSATSVPSSASSFSIQHSDSNSSMYRDSYNTLMSGPFMVQQSASTSSVNHDMEGRKVHRHLQQAPDSLDEAGKLRQPIEKGETIHQDVIKNVIQSYVDQTTSEDESSSTTSVRIDNKIEAAMDLVKKHLMLAVRDEVDELKEKIVELQDDNYKIKKENDLLKGVLTSEQVVTVHQILTKQVLPGQQQKPTSLQQSQPQVPVYNLPIQSPQQTQDKGLPSQPAQMQVHQHLGHTPSLPTNAQLQHGYGGSTQPPPTTPSTNMPAHSVHMNPGLLKSQHNLPLVQQQQLATAKTQLPAMQPHAAPVSTQPNYPPNLYQMQPTQQQVPLSGPQMQALRQQQAAQGAAQQPLIPATQSQYQIQPAPTLPAGSYAQNLTFQQANVARPHQPPLALSRQQSQQQTSNVSSVTSPVSSGTTHQAPQSYQVQHPGTAGHVTNNPAGVFVPASSAPLVSNQKSIESRASQS